MVEPPFRIDSPQTSTTALRLSIEVFPPAACDGIDALAATVSRLLVLEPAFVSVTYGAGGSTSQRSLAVVARLMAATRGRVAAHLTCVATPRPETDRIIDAFRALGVERFVALRGDVPEAGPAEGGYEDAVALVDALRRRGARDISVAAYPEVHPKAASADADIDVLRAKCEAGACRAITQFFLDNGAFHRFRDQLARIGFGWPLVPGVLLFENFARAAQFARRCGTGIPDHVARRFAAHETDPTAMRREAQRFLAEQIRDLLRQGVDHIHLYTLNRAELALELFGGIDLFGSHAAAKGPALTAAA